MAEERVTKRRVEIEVSAKDLASAPMEQVARAAQKMGKDVAGVTGSKFGADVANTIAGRTRAMEAAAYRARVDEEARRQMFGEPDARRDPLRIVSRSVEDQAVRDAMAGRIRAMREESMRQRVEEEAQRRLFGGDPSTRSAKDVVEKGQKSFAEGLHEQAKELKHSLKFMMELGGAAIAVEAFTRVVKGATEGVKTFAESRKFSGRSANEMLDSMGSALAKVPVVGELGSALNDAFNYFSGRQERFDREEQMRKLKDDLENSKSQRMARDREAVNASVMATMESARSARLVGREGDERRAIEIANRFEAEMQKLQREELDAREKKLSPDAFDDVMGDIEVRKQFAQSQRTQEQVDLSRERGERMYKAQVDSDRAVEETRFQIAQEGRRQRGMVLEAEIEDIRKAAKDKRQEVLDNYTEGVKGKGTDEIDLLYKQTVEQMNAIRDRSSQLEQAARDRYREQYQTAWGTSEVDNAIWEAARGMAERVIEGRASRGPASIQGEARLLSGFAGMGVSRSNPQEETRELTRKIQKDIASMATDVSRLGAEIATNLLGAGVELVLVKPSAGR